MIDVYTWFQLLLLGVVLVFFFYLLLAVKVVEAVAIQVKAHLDKFYNLHRSQIANKAKATKKVKESEDNVLGKLIDKVPPEVIGDLAKSFLKVRDKKK